VRGLLALAPLRLTFWILVGATAVIVVLIAILIASHGESARADRRRERIRGELGPLLSRFLQAEDPVRLAEELHPASLRMNAAERPVAAVLITDLMQAASAPQTEQLRRALQRAGIVELGERGTWRLSPWRRALACELLEKIGVQGSAPAPVERLGDRRPEVRLAAVPALGDSRSSKVVHALAEAFLARRCAAAAVVNDALRRIGDDAATAFERGTASPDPIVRVSSCFGLAGIGDRARDADPARDAPRRLADVHARDLDARVRSAAAGALGIVGGGHAPAALLGATTDVDVHVRRAAVKALGSFDDPTTGETLGERVEDEDREIATGAAETLVALTRRPHAAPAAGARLERSSAWAVECARKVAEVSA
jgi:HEAT repeat protein